MLERLSHRNCSLLSSILRCSIVFAEHGGWPFLEVFKYIMSMGNSVDVLRQSISRGCPLLRWSAKRGSTVQQIVVPANIQQERCVRPLLMLSILLLLQNSQKTRVQDAMLMFHLIKVVMIKQKGLTMCDNMWVVEQINKCHYWLNIFWYVCVNGIPCHLNVLEVLGRPLLLTTVMFLAGPFLHQ